MEKVSSRRLKSALFLIVVIIVPVLIQAETIQFSYDQNGRLADLTFQNNQRISFAYDAAGNLLKRSQGAVVSAPVLTVKTSGVKLSLTWTPVANATGYSLVYAPYPYPANATINTIDLGDKTNFSMDLWDGAAFYVAVRAYNALGNSDFSNIETIQLSLAN